MDEIKTDNLTEENSSEVLEATEIPAQETPVLTEEAAPAEETAPVAETAPAEDAAPAVQRETRREAVVSPLREKKPATNAKKFGILYGVYALALAILLVISAVFNAAPAYKSAGKSKEYLTGLSVAHNIYDSTHSYAVNLIRSELLALGFSEVFSTNNTSGDRTNADIPEALSGKPVFTVQETAMSAVDRAASADALGREYDSTQLFIPVTVYNIIAYIPGSKTNSDAALLTAGYDTSEYTAGASDMTAAAALLNDAGANVLKSGENALVYVFADAENYDSLGLYAFRERFAGFNSVVSRIRAAAGFYPQGTTGRIYAQTNFKGAPNTPSASFMSGFSSVSGGAQLFSSSAVYSNYGQNGRYRTLSDNIDNVSDKLLSAYCDEIARFSAYALKADLSDISQAAEYGISFFGLFNIRYGATMPYVTGGIILFLLLCIGVYLYIVKKLGALVAGFFTAIFSLAGGLAFAYGAYYFIGFIFSVTGVIPSGILSVFSSYSFAALFFTGVFALAGYLFANTVFKKIFRVPAQHVVRGNVFALGIAAAFVCFFAPAFCIIPASLALLTIPVLAYSVLFGKRFKERFFVFDMLMPYLWPVLLTMPFVAAPLLLVAGILGAHAYPMILLGLLAVAGFVAPYFSYLDPFIQKIFDKIPLTVRIERVEEVREEDKAKKGKFTTVKKKVIYKEKRSAKYSAIKGSIALALVALIVAFPLYAVRTTPAYSVTTHSQGSLGKALVYTIDLTPNAPYNNFWAVHDPSVQKYVGMEIRGFTYNDTVSAHIKEDDVSRSKADTFRAKKETTGENSGKIKTIKITPYDDTALFSLHFPATASVAEITISGYDNTPRGLNVSMKYTLDEYETLDIVNLRGSSVITITGVSSAYSGTIVYEEVSFNPNSLSTLQDFELMEELTKAYEGSTFLDNLRVGLVIKQTFSV